MPHNRTRFWVGLAIVGITIPAVGFYYGHSSGNSPSTIVAANSTSGSIVPVGLYRGVDAASDELASSRDFAGEVQAAVMRSSGDASVDPAKEYQALDDTMFAIGPVDDSYDIATSSDPSAPDPASAVAPRDNPQVAFATDGPVVDDSPSVANDSLVADYANASPTMSDATIYSLVVNNLSGEDRDEFIRAYAAMTPDQRSALLDGFRSQLQGDDSP